MQRHSVRIDDDVVYVEGDDEWLPVGDLDDIFDLVGGETVVADYDDDAAAADWLDLDDGTLEIDVRDALSEFTFPTPFVAELLDRPFDPDTDGVPERTRYFADVMYDVWTSGGNLANVRDDNPFTS